MAALLSHVHLDPSGKPLRRVPAVVRLPSVRISDLSLLKTTVQSVKLRVKCENSKNFRIFTGRLLVFPRTKPHEEEPFCACIPQMCVEQVE